METLAQISTAELIDIVTASERCENQLNEIRRIIENEYPSHAYRLIAGLLFIKETYEEKWDREQQEKVKAMEAEEAEKQRLIRKVTAEAATLKTVSVPEYMGAGDCEGQQEE